MNTAAGSWYSTLCTRYAASALKPIWGLPEVRSHTCTCRMRHKLTMNALKKFHKSFYGFTTKLLFSSFGSESVSIEARYETKWILHTKERALWKEFTFLASSFFNERQLLRMLKDNFLYVELLSPGGNENCFQTSSTSLQMGIPQEGFIKTILWTSSSSSPTTRGGAESA